MRVPPNKYAVKPVIAQSTIHNPQSTIHNPQSTIHIAEGAEARWSSSGCFKSRALQQNGRTALEPLDARNSVFCLQWCNAPRVAFVDPNGPETIALERVKSTLPGFPKTIYGYNIMFLLAYFDFSRTMEIS